VFVCITHGNGMSAVPLSMDSWQSKSERVMKRKIGMPVIHVAQLVGLALGFSPRELGLEQHIIRPAEIIANYSR
jgi:succinate dehydrogenase / fumarate reductase, cytochrome b subunit